MGEPLGGGAGLWPDPQKPSARCWSTQCRLATSGRSRFGGALLDRVTHRVHLLEMSADSYRLKHSRRKRP